MTKSFARLVLVLPLALLLCLAFSCQKRPPVVNLKAEKAAVKTVVDKFMQSLKTKDIETLSKIFAHDSDMVYIGSGDKFVGWESVREQLESGFFKTIDVEGFSIRDQVIKVHNSGEVAWFSEITAMKAKYQGQSFGIDVRWTGVLEKRAGNWVIVQSHDSYPSSN